MTKQEDVDMPDDAHIAAVPNNEKISCFSNQSHFSPSLIDCCLHENESLRILYGDSLSSNWTESLQTSPVSWLWDDGCASSYLLSPSNYNRERASSTSSLVSSSNQSQCSNTTISLVTGDISRISDLKHDFSSSPPGASSSSSFPNEDSSPGPVSQSTRFSGGNGTVNVVELPTGWLHPGLLARRAQSSMLLRQDSLSSLEIVHPSEVSAGVVDIQGIPWNKFSISRADYRERRMTEYSNYNNVCWNMDTEYKRRKSIQSPLSSREGFFRFGSAYRTVLPTIDHFQLRHLLWTPSNAETFYVSSSCLYKFNRITKEIMRVHAQSENQMACCHVDYGFAASGAFDSEICVTRLEDNKTVVRRKISSAENCLTNHVALFNEGSSLKLISANNDSVVRELDIGADGKICSDYVHQIPINHVSVSTSTKLMCLAGDSCDLSVIDRTCNRPVARLTGHLDYAFCSDWFDNIICSGSQDGTCRLWDIRMAGQPYKVLGGLLGAIRSTKFSACGRFLAFSEPADFVHIYDIHSSYDNCQVLDFFGNIAGIAFSPDTSRFSVSISDSMFGSLIEYKQLTRHSNRVSSVINDTMNGDVY